MTPLSILCIISGLIIGFYWARVIKLVLKQKKKHGESAQFVPAEPLGRVLRVIWYPVVGFWIWHAWGVLLHVPRGKIMQPLIVSPWLGFPALGVMAIALGLTMVCWRKMGKSWRMGILPGEKTQLVVSGPYSRVRHPIYALSSLLMLASVAALPTIPLMVAAALHLAFLQWEARREEGNLIRVHGETYLAYMRSTGRFIPALWRGA